MGDLLQGLLHAIALLLGIIRALVLFLGIRALLLVSSLLLLLIFGGTHFAIVGVTLLSIIWHILSHLFLNDGGFRHLNSVALLLILLMTLLFLRFIFSISTSCLQVLFLSYYIKLSLYIYVWLQVYTWVWIPVDWLVGPPYIFTWLSASDSRLVKKMIQYLKGYNNKKEEVITDDREKYRVYLEEEELEKAMVEGKKRKK